MDAGVRASHQHPQRPTPLQPRPEQVFRTPPSRHPAMESVASAGIAMEQMLEDFGEPCIFYDGHVGVQCVSCQLQVFDFRAYLRHVESRHHRKRSVVIRRRQAELLQELERLRQQAREAIEREAMQ